MSRSALATTVRFRVFGVAFLVLLLAFVWLT